MVKISTIFALGILTAIVQYTGFPKSFKDFLYIVFGLAIAVLSYLIRRELMEVVKKMHDIEIAGVANTTDSSQK